MIKAQNKLIIAAAGSGKTTFLVNEALKHSKTRILITTYTQANEEEIRRKIIRKHKCIPSNITIQTWYSFLLQHGARPYQGGKFNEEITGLLLVNGQSAQGISESKTEQHYFTANHKIYSDKLSKFVVSCNEISNGAVIDRLSRIYSYIFIDEVQDLAGHDLEFLKLLFNSTINVLLVGDPRQGTYSTNSSSKNMRYRRSLIVNFFMDDTLNIIIDDTSLLTNYRSVKSICDLSNELYPDFPKTTSGNTQMTDHDGVFVIKKAEVAQYLSKYNATQLRDSIKKNINEDFGVMTFGKSKGLEFDRVIIYPTKPFVDWLINRQTPLKPVSCSKFYVAITRARYSVGIVYDYNDEITINGIQTWQPENDN